MAAILSPLSLYGGNRKTKLPLLRNTRIHAPEGHVGILVVAPSDGCLATAPRLASMQALRSRRVSSVSKSLGTPGSCLHPPSLRSWLCGSTNSIVLWTTAVNPVDLVQPPRQSDSWLGPHAHPSSVLVLWSKPTNPACRLQLRAATLHRLAIGFEAQPRNRTWLRLAFLATMRPALDLVRPLGPSSRAYLSLHSSEATQTNTFRAHSSPAPTQIKLQPTPAILSQE
jgi:hypothetical protein